MDRIVIVRKLQNRWIALGFVLVATLIVTLNQTVMSVLAPTIIRAFDTDIVVASLSTTIYLAAAASFLIPAGRLSDLVGHKWFLIVALALFAVATAIVGYTSETWQLLAGRGLQGLVFAGIMPVGLAIINNDFSVERGKHARSMALGAWATVTGVAITLGPLWGGFWAHSTLGWRWAFHVTTGVVIVIMVGCAVSITGHARSDRKLFHGFDIPGLTALVVGIALLVFGLEEGRQSGWISSSSAGFSIDRFSIAPILFAGSVLAFAAFVLIERRRNRRGEIAIGDASLLRIKSFRWSTLAISLTFFGNFGLLFVFSIYMQLALGYTALTAGVALASTGLGVLVGGQIASHLPRRVDVRSQVIASVTAQPVVLLIAAISIDSSVLGWTLLAILFLYGATWGLSYAAFVNLAYQDVPAERAAAASGTQVAMRVLAGSVGTAVLGSVLAAMLFTGIHQAIAARTDLTEQQRDEMSATLHSSFIVQFPPDERDRDVVDELADASGPARHPDEAVAHIYATAFRTALLIAALVSSGGVVCAFLIPHMRPRRTTRQDPVVR